jgi:DNA modification methylase
MKESEIKHSIEYRSTDSLIPYARNSRTHNDAQVSQIAASIREFGFTNPILIDAESGIIAGHGRVLAAQKLGMDEVPCIVLDYMTDAQKKAYVITDNKLALNAGWDDELLMLELADLTEMDFDLDVIGFSEEELAGLMGLDAEVVDGLTDEDAVPDAPDEPVAVDGDVWALGNHRLMCGDSTSIDAMEKLVGSHKADMIFTDPPYGMSYGGGRSIKPGETDGTIKNFGMIKGDDLKGDDLVALVRDAIASSIACTKEGAPLYACLTWRTYAEFEASLDALGREVKACVVWDKKSIGLGNSHYRPQHEFIFYCGGQWHGDKSQSDVWHMGRGNTGAYVHPTQKPVELIERALGNSSKSGDVVIDCFGGSGSTLIACEKLHRHARLMELDPKYCDVIIKRWQDFTGQKAIHTESGKAFDEVAME